MVCLFIRVILAYAHVHKPNKTALWATLQVAALSAWPLSNEHTAISAAAAAAFNRVAFFLCVFFPLVLAFFAALCCSTAAGFGQHLHEHHLLQVCHRHWVCNANDA